ncbi:hypothetical protein DFS34DRAFT_648072 [Phlyctochytrium arcticum]|nr:hypothetical protein DFS34DRAFT_648072 [Phlyctochytrium arcticum]
MPPRNIQPIAVSKPAPKLPSIGVELTQVKNQIKDIRNKIEAQEKLLRENIAIRRVQFQPYTIFSANVPPTSLANEEDYARELISRAKDELLRRSGQQKKKDEMDANQQIETDDQLRLRILNTRKQYRQKEGLLKAGPQFVRHFCSTNGEVMHVHLLANQLYMIFAGNNVLEFWEFPREGADPLLRDMIHLDEIQDITAVCDLLQEDITPFPESEEPVDGSQAASMASSRRASLVDSHRQPVSHSVGGNSMKIHAAQPPRGSPMSWDPSGLRKGIALRNHQMMGEVVEEEDGDDGAQQQSTPRMGSLQQLRGNAEAGDPLAEPAPVVVVKHSFFLGSKTGMGYIFEVDTYFCSVSRQRQLSITAVRMCKFAAHEDSIVCLVTHHGTESVLAAYNLLLEDEWQCKEEILRYTSKDKQLKVIAQTRLEVAKEGDKLGDDRPGTSLSLPSKEGEESAVASVTVDAIHRHILVAMRSGAILRLNCETVMSGGNKEKDKEKKKEEPTEVEKESEHEAPPINNQRRATQVLSPAELAIPTIVRKDLFVAWILDVQALPSKNLPAPRPGQTPASSTKEDASTKNRATLMFRTGFSVVTKHMSVFMHHASDKACLLLSCADGSLRMYPMDLGLATVVPTVYGYTDQDREPGMGNPDQALVWSDVLQMVSKKDGTFKQFIMAYTADGIFLIYRIGDPNPLLQMRILSNRYTTPNDQSGFSHSHRSATQSKPGTRPTTSAIVTPLAPRLCYALNEDGTICAILAGRDWSIVNAHNISGWDIKDFEPA